MTAEAPCSHCQLPVGRHAQRREVNGSAHWFCCYGCCLAYQVHHGSAEEPEAAYLLIRLGVGGFLAMNIMLFSLLLYTDAVAGAESWLSRLVPWLLWALTTPLLVVVGGPFLLGAWDSALRGRLTGDSLVSLGALAAYVYSGWQVIQGSDQVYFDTATMVLVLFTLGRYLEAQGRARAARSLAPMLAAERAEVRVLGEGGESMRRVEQVRPGDILRIYPGERIAIDGQVVEGWSECDESILTGQPEPQPKAPGDQVHAGSLNGSGPLSVRASTRGDQTHWIQISQSVREALARKSLVGEAVDRAASYFLPLVLVLAVATVWFWTSRVGFDQALLAGLSVLVVACPCALGLAAPLATALGIGRAARRGVLIRGAGVLERLGRLKGIAFDKTGTLTRGELRPVSVTVDGASEAEVLRVAQALGRGSVHPVARAIAARAAACGIAMGSTERVRIRLGAGVAGEVDGVFSAIGSSAFMTQLGWPVPVALAPAAGQADCTLVYVGWTGRVQGRLDLMDIPRSEARQVVADLMARGLQVQLLSGDERGPVARLAGLLGISVWQAGLTPEAKAGIVGEWARREGPIAMVGDGLNDGLVLAAAPLGIAVGGGTDLAKESADVVLPDDGLGALPWVLDLAGTVRRSIRVNLSWAFGYNAGALALAAAGLLQPVLAAALMAGSSLLVLIRTLSWQAAAAVAEGQPKPAHAKRTATVPNSREAVA